MAQFSLSTFLKIACFDPTKKIQEFEKNVEGGGFPYYRELYDAVDVVTWRNGSLAEALAKIEAIKMHSRRKNLRDAFDAFCQLYLGKGYSFHQPPREIFESESKNFTLSVRPIALAERDGKRELVYPWAVIKPTLQPRIAGICIDIMTRCFKSKKIDLYVVADLRRKERHVASSTSTLATAMTASEIAFCDAFIRSTLEKAA